MRLQSRKQAVFGWAGLPLGLSAVLLLCLSPGAPAQPAPQLPPELQYVPSDAAIFVHTDAAKVWDGTIGKAVRSADTKLVEKLAGEAKGMFGLTPDQLRSVTVFLPQLRGPKDLQSFGIVLTFRTAYDQDKLKSGIGKALQGLPYTLHSPSDRLAVVLVGLDNSFATPRTQGKPGPLTTAIQEAATGTHLLVIASTLAKLPDEIRGNNLPPEVRPFQPLLAGESITGFVDWGRELAVEVRVKANTPAQAIESEKALGLLTKLLEQGLGTILQNPNMSDTLTILKAVQAGVKGATFKTEGTETRTRISISADLPFDRALAEAAIKIREAAARSQSSNNLKQIVLAMYNYESTYGALPPPVVVNKAGKPLLSWRVLILPFIEQQQLYKQFKLDEPWDSPNNIKLLDKMPRVYAEPAPTKAKKNETHYRVFVGNGAAFDSLRGPKLVEFTDGTSNTILVATAADPVPWTKPDELSFEPDKDMKKLLGFFYGPVTMVGFADGSVRAISQGISKTTLNALLTRAGGEVPGDDF